MSDSKRRSKRLGPLVLEMLFIFVGLSGAFFVENFRDSREGLRRAEFVAGALYQDLRESGQVMAFFGSRIDEGLAAFDERIERGERPVPFVLEIRGARTPVRMWEMAAELGLGDMENVALTFELAFFYNERDGVADNFARYARFTDEVFWPLALADTTAFYDGRTGALRGEFQGHVQLLRDYRQDISRLVEWATALQGQLREEFPGIELAPPESMEENRYESSIRTR